MAKVTSVENCRTAREFERAVQRQGGWIEQGGNHARLCHPDGGKVALPRHAGDLATGTRHSIMKMLLSLGFMVVTLSCCFALYVSAVVQAGGF